MCVIRCHMSMRQLNAFFFFLDIQTLLLPGRMSLITTFYKFVWDIFIAHAVLAPLPNTACNYFVVAVVAEGQALTN